MNQNSIENERVNVYLKNIYDGNGNECVVCLDEKENLVVMVPCGHHVVCQECASTIFNGIKNAHTCCPMCRVSVTTIATRDQITLI